MIGHRVLPSDPSPWNASKDSSFPNRPTANPCFGWPSLVWKFGIVAPKIPVPSRSSSPPNKQSVPRAHYLDATLCPAGARVVDQDQCTDHGGRVHRFAKISITLHIFGSIRCRISQPCRKTRWPNTGSESPPPSRSVVSPRPDANATWKPDGVAEVRFSTGSGTSVSPAR